MMLAVSGGLSSSVLVDLVYTAVLRTRGKHEMPIVLHVDDVDYTGTSNAHVIDILRRKYPEMQFLERVLDKSTTFSGSEAVANTVSTSQSNDKTQPESQLRQCIASLTSKTSQEDMVALYRDRLILRTAREQNCEAVLFGNSATSLAAKTLSLTAKGRGYALPWETADHCLSHTGIWNIRPLKGLMQSELLIYSRLIQFPVDLEIAVKSGKPNSIDHLTQRYFVNLEEQFPSLVATVVRTTNKLVEPVAREQALGDCQICGMSYRHGARKWLRDITVSQSAPDESGTGPSIPYEETTSEPENLCYGCVVALRGAKGELQWPMLRDPEGPQIKRNNDKQSILDEFELDNA